MRRRIWHCAVMWRKLRENPSLLTSAIEEMLRYESPVARQPRVIKDDVELGGQKLRKGQVAFQMLNAANRDPAYFPDPETFNIERQNNKHLAFGMGIHFCLGAGLARTEAQEVFKAIIERLPNIELASDKPVWDCHKPNSRVLHTLPVTFLIVFGLGEILKESSMRSAAQLVAVGFDILLLLGLVASAAPPAKLFKPPQRRFFLAVWQHGGQTPQIDQEATAC